MNAFWSSLFGTNPVPQRTGRVHVFRIHIDFTTCEINPLAVAIRRLSLDERIFDYDMKEIVGA